MRRYRARSGGRTPNPQRFGAGGVGPVGVWRTRLPATHRSAQFLLPTFVCGSRSVRRGARPRLRRKSAGCVAADGRLGHRTDAHEPAPATTATAPECGCWWTAGSRRAPSRTPTVPAWSSAGRQAGRQGSREDVRGEPVGLRGGDVTEEPYSRELPAATQTRCPMRSRAGMVTPSARLTQLDGRETLPAAPGLTQ